MDETSENFRSSFEDRGYATISSLLSRRECRTLLRELRTSHVAGDWPKACATTTPAYYRIASDDRIVERVSELIGRDVMLWGARLVSKEGGKHHPWHTDVESGLTRGRTVSVWIGLEHTEAASTFGAVARSHQFDTSVQECAHEENVARDDISDMDVLRWARRRDPGSHIEMLNLSDGDALFFDGKLWHGTKNHSSQKRTALLLQYATAETPIRIPEVNGPDWPVRFADEPRPPCLLVHGTGRSDANRFVSPPIEASEQGELSWIGQLPGELEESVEEGWRPYPLYRGPTPSMTALSCHASVLSSGRIPHPPHRHPHEELLIVLSGEPDLIIVDEEGIERAHPVQAADVVYYPAEQLHTIRNATDGPVSYLMFKWRSGTRSAGNGTAKGVGPRSMAATMQADSTKLDTFIYRTQERAAFDESKLFAMRVLFSGPTAYLNRMRCHETRLQPGAGYAAHIDAHDVAIVVLEGTVETMGRRVMQHGVIYYAAGDLHDMRNVGDTAARYLVFEFKGEGAARARRAGLRRVGQSLHGVRRIARRLKRRLKNLRLRPA